MPTSIGPSLMCCDLARVADEVAHMEADGADFLHVDIMDGQFVPNLTLGPAVVRAVRRATELPIDVHLMVERAERHLDAVVGGVVLAVQRCGLSLSESYGRAGGIPRRA